MADNEVVTDNKVVGSHNGCTSVFANKTIANVIGNIIDTVNIIQMQTVFTLNCKNYLKISSNG